MKHSARSTERASQPERARPQRREAPAIPSGLVLGTLLERQGSAFRVRVAGAERLLPWDPAVDPALLEQAMASGARVVVELGAAPAIVGALVVARPLSIDRHGDVEARVRRLRLTAVDEVLLRTGGAFARLKGGELELYGDRVLTRAREVARILGRMIKLN